MSVALRNLLDWVDKGKVPPRAERMGAIAAVDANGNVMGGIRNPYVDVPVAKFNVRNEAANPPIPNPSAWVAAHGASAPGQMCGLAGYQTNYSKEQLQKLYGNKKAFQDRVKKNVAELEKTGWSLPVYRDSILADAAKVSF